MASSDPEVPYHVSQTVESIANLHTQAQAGLSRQQQWIEWLMARLGRPATLYATAGSVLVWISINLLLIRSGVPAVDPPPFSFLQGVLTLASLLTTTIVLITQNRQTRHTEQRARLDLQVNLMAEAKIAKLIGLLEELRHDMPSVPNRIDRVAEAMQRTIDPAEALATLEETLENKAQAAREPEGT